MIFRLYALFFVVIINTIAYSAQDVKTAREAARTQAHCDQKGDLKNSVLDTKREMLAAVPLQRLVLDYKKPLLSPIDAAAFPAKDSAHGKLALAASAGLAANAAHNYETAVPAAAAAAGGRTGRRTVNKRNLVSNIVELRASQNSSAYRRFAIQRGNTLQAWQLHDDYTAHKEAHEHEILGEGDEQQLSEPLGSRLTRLYDGTLLATTAPSLGRYSGLLHWDSQTNSAHRYHYGDWFPSHKPSDEHHPHLILPLKSGKIFLFFPEVFFAENVTALSKKLKRCRIKLPPVLHGIDLSGDIECLILFHKSHFALYYPIVFMKNPNQRQRQRGIQDMASCTEPLPKDSETHGVAKIASSSFITWGKLPGNSSRSFVQAWALCEKKLRKTHDLTCNTMIANAAITHGKCIVICEDGTAKTCEQRGGEQRGGEQWEDVSNCTDASSLTTLSDGTVVMAHRDGSISMVNNPNHLLKAFALRQLQTSCAHSKKLHESHHKNLMAEIKAKAPQIIAHALLKKKEADATQK